MTSLYELSPPVRDFEFRNPGNFLLVETVIQENFPCGIRNRGLWNSEYSLRNPESLKRCEVRNTISSDID